MIAFGTMPSEDSFARKAVKLNAITAGLHLAPKENRQPEGPLQQAVCLQLV